MSFYSEISDLVLEMLTEFGTSVTLRRYSQGGGNYNPDTTISVPLGITGTYDETRKALLADQPGSQISIHFGQTLQNGSLVQSSDKWVYMDASGSAPTLQDHVILGSSDLPIDYSIINVQVTSPGGVPVLYLLVLRL